MEFETAMVLIQNCGKRYLAKKNLKMLPSIPNSNNLFQKSQQNEYPNKNHRLNIEEFTKLIQCDTVGSPNKIPVEPSSNLTSFRMNLEDGLLSINSFNQDTSAVMGFLPISPITAINIPNSFTTESDKHINEPQKISPMGKKPSIIVTENKDSSGEINTSQFLFPSLNKLANLQYTPTFPMKNNQNTSWENIQIENFKEPKKDSSRFVKIPSSSVSMEIDEPQLFVVADNKEITEKGTQKNNDVDIKLLDVIPISFTNSFNERQSSETGSKKELKIYKADDAPVSNERSIFEDKEKSLAKCTTNPFLKMPNRAPPGERISFKVSSVVNSTKIIKKKKAFQTEKLETKPIILNDKKSQATRAGARSKSGHNLITLPKIKSRSTKFRSQSKTNPYSPDWNQNMLKNFFQLEMKVDNARSGLKVYVKKAHKKPK